MILRLARLVIQPGSVQMHPDDLFANLFENAVTRKKRNLEIIHAVCREQFERGSKDFSVATISRLSVERGGPASSPSTTRPDAIFKHSLRRGLRTLVARSRNRPSEPLGSTTVSCFRKFQTRLFARLWEPPLLRIPNCGENWPS